MQTSITYKTNKETKTIDVYNVRGVTTDFPLSFIHGEKEMIVINFYDSIIERHVDGMLKEKIRYDIFVTSYTSGK